MIARWHAKFLGLYLWAKETSAKNELAVPLPHASFSLLLLLLFPGRHSPEVVVEVVVGFSFDLYSTNKHSGDDDFIMMLQTD